MKKVLACFAIIALLFVIGCNTKNLSQQNTETHTPETQQVQEWCKVTTTRNAMGSITRIETENIEGKNVQMCCTDTEMQIDNKISRLKQCQSKDAKYFTQWEYDETTGKMYRSVIIFHHNDQTACQKNFDPDGSMTLNTC